MDTAKRRLVSGILLILALAAAAALRQQLDSLRAPHAVESLPPNASDAVKHARSEPELTQPLVMAVRLANPEDLFEPVTLYDDLRQKAHAGDQEGSVAGDHRLDVDEHWDVVDGGAQRFVLRDAGDLKGYLTYSPSLHKVTRLEWLNPKWTLDMAFQALSRVSFPQWTRPEVVSDPASSWSS